jgi:DNA-binding transcriptional LysR family regulator
MDLRHMRYFIAVADELHFTRAAEKLRIAQPALSKQIRDLEDEVGATLLNRSGRSISLSDAGRVFYERASLALQAAEAALVETRRAQRGETGKIAIGFFEQSAYTLLPPILRAYRLSFPDVDVQLRWLSVTAQCDALRRGDTDVAFIRSIANLGPIDGLDQLSAIKLHREKFVLAIPEAHHLRARETVKIAECANEPFVGYPEAFAPDFHAMVMRQCALHGFSPRLSLEVGQSYTLLGLVSAGTGIAFVPASAQKMKFEGVLFKRLDDELPEIEIYLAWRAQKPSALLAAFIDTAQATVCKNILPRDPSFIVT